MAVGDIVGALTAVGGAATSFVLINNPGGFFAISGSNLIEAVNTPDGIYPITIKAIGPGYQATTSFSLDFTGSQPIPPPIGTFYIGMNLSGLENSFPSVPTLQEITYLVGKGFNVFRVPIAWGGFNGTTGALFGVQQAQFAALNGSAVSNITACLDNIHAAGAVAVLDIHGFGNGPGANGLFAISGVTSSGTTCTATYSGASTLANGATVVVNGFWPPIYNGGFTISNVTGTTFQYTVASAPASTPATNIVNISQTGWEQAQVGSASLPIAAFVDLWQRLITQFGSHPALTSGKGGIDNMNEWQNGFDVNIAIAAEQAVINAVRAPPYNFTGYIYCEGVNFTGTWNWVTGQGQPFNNSGLNVLSDPLNKLIFEPHQYYDRDNSGTHYSYAIESTTPGLAPPGIMTNPQIGVQRLTPFVAWSSSHGVEATLGESGSSSDPLIRGGNLNYDAWNTILSNTLTYAQANLIPFWSWGNGPGFAPGFWPGSTGYPFNSEPFSVISPNSKDYTSLGVQAPQMTVLAQFAGYAGPQPTAYATALPQTITSTGNPLAPIVNPNPYGSVGVASGPFYVYYGGIVPTGNRTIFLADFLADGVTPAGGTFSRSSIVLTAGATNALETFTYTPSQSATILIKTTNNAGWSDPPQLGFSSIADPFSTFVFPPTNCYGLYRRYTPSVRPAMRLVNPQTGLRQDWYFNNDGSFPRDAIQLWANANVGIPVAIWYDQSPLQNDIIMGGRTTLSGDTTFFTGSISGINITISNINGSPGLFVTQYLCDPALNIAPNTQIATLTVVGGQVVGGTVTVSQNVSSQIIFSQNPIGNNGVSYPVLSLTESFEDYPAIVFPTTAYSYGNFGSPIAQQNQMTWNARFNQNASANMGLFREDLFTGPIILTGAAVQIVDTGWSNGLNYGSAGQIGSDINQNITTGTYGEYAFVYNSGVTNGTKTYKNGSVVTSATFSYTLGPAFNDGTIHLGWFQFSSSPKWFGSLSCLDFWQGLAATDAQITAVKNYDLAYYSTPLPALPVINPGVNGTQANQPIFPTLYPNIYPFQFVTITDGNAAPTDTVTITLTGPGTLSGAGISGTGPYTIGPDTPANVTASLNTALLAAGSTTVGVTTTFALHVVSSAGSSTNNTNSSVVVTTYVAETTLTPPVGTFTPFNTFGVNLSGMEFASVPPAGIAPPNFVANYFAGKGLGLMRVPFTGLFLQPTAFAPLSSTCIAAIKAVVDNCFANNQYAILDLHDFGGVYNNGVRIDAQLGIGSNLFSDIWRRLGTLFKNYPNVWFGLMNEPTQATAAGWVNGAVIPAVTALRSTGATQKITLPGIGFASARDFVSNGSAAAYTGFSADPLNNFIFEGHQYLDSNNSGGSPVATQPGATILVAMTTWLSANSYQGFLGEFGMAPDPFHPVDTGANILTWDSSQPPITTNSIIQNGNMLAYMKTNRAQWPAWTAWTAGAYVQIPRTGAYGFQQEPLRNAGQTAYIVPIVDQQTIAPLLAGI